ncbi:hypothetical protein NESM_000500400 [Novymonas esmeraldas]|uniref:Uncharacterized protein n=1 Tax=Novymonas esmeraldas TaxID=1808958 RepID=A0AAW0ER92_9TRYP
MKVAPVYRRVLKQLGTACRTHPHFVQDIRFLLSLPLHNSADTSQTAEGHTRAATSASANGPQVSADRAEYLRRPSSACYAIDSDALLAACCADMHTAVREVVPLGAGMNPVASQILRYRNLLWLQERLSRVLSGKTQDLLTAALSISKGPTDDDFIPDSFFHKSSAGDTGAAASPATEAVPPRNRDGAGDTSEDGAEGSVGSCKTDGTADATTRAGAAGAAGAIPAVGVEENDPAVVYSAGAVGQQHEMFVLRHREPFPMATQFLSGFSVVAASKLAACACQQAALTKLVRQEFPTAVTCEDARVRLSVSLGPYDAEYTSKEHAGVGYFADAHRQFRVRFSLVPLAPNGAGAERTEVLVVNSYFVRLDMELMQLVEEVGYLHSSDVLRMLRERDYGDHLSDFVGGGVADILSDGVLAAHGDGAGGVDALPPPSSSADAAESPPRCDTPVPADGRRVFSLYFVNHTDSPMVLKGMLYYKIAPRCQLAQASIHCIPFGSLRMEA